ncbi:50S ribosomal protein L4 [Candidatus Peregrinibacteria bacterium]|nr:50S ribosomal protein L4 [Candidatus Peregrinibacteria bacterium]
MKIDLYTQMGEKKGQITLNENIFGIKVNHDLMHQYLRYQQANKRIAIAHTKTKGEVRGGGRKPHPQKGTGRARQGSTRNPHMKGGGVAFGPRNTQNFSLMMPKKQRRKALFSYLSALAKGDQIFAIENYDNEIKTKTFKTMMEKLPIQRNALFVLSKKHESLEKSARNIKNVKTLLVNYLNPEDLLKYEKVVFIEEALKEIENIFLKLRKPKIS